VTADRTHGDSKSPHCQVASQAGPTLGESMIASLNTVAPPPRRSPPSPPVQLADSVDWLLCHCGRRCKGRRGLRAHQRGCRTIDRLVGVDPNIDRAAFNYGPTGDTASIDDINRLPTSTPSLQPVAGLRLPRNQQGWDEASTYFRAYPSLPDSLVNLDLNECSAQLQTSISS